MASKRIPLAWKNLVHEPRRLIVAMGGIGFAVVLMFMQLGFRNALFDSTVAVHRMLNADLVITSTARYTLSVKETFSRRRLDAGRGLPGVESAWPLYIETALSIWKNPETGQGYPIRVLAFDPHASGAGYSGAGNAGSCAANAGRNAGGSPLERGLRTRRRSAKSIELSNHATRIVGTFDLGTDFSNDGNVILQRSRLQRLFQPAQGAGTTSWPTWTWA